jgi:hypothetical protein
MNETSRISCLVHTRDSEATLETALASVAWVDELIVIDMASRDRTREIASKYAARILEAPVVARVDGIRNRYLEEAVHDWVFVLDSDESLADDGEENLRRLVLEAGSQIDAYAIPRFNRIAGQLMRGSGWYPDRQIRLFRKGAVQWSDATHVAPSVVTGRERLSVLEPPGCLHIHHQNYEDLSHFLDKQLRYALNDDYDSDPANFHFEDYLARAYDELARRRQPDRDGDLSRALSLAMAWDAVVRGLVHWDRLDPRPALPDAIALPPVVRKRRKHHGRLWRFGRWLRGRPRGGPEKRR